MNNRATAQELKLRLKKLGLSDRAVEVAWPRWWSDEADSSASARVELRFSIARKLGLDPNSLLEDELPHFVWKDEARFKHLSGEEPLELSGITSFGKAVGSLLVAGSPPAQPIYRQPASPHPARQQRHGRQPGRRDPRYAPGTRHPSRKFPQPILRRHHVEQPLIDWSLIERSSLEWSRPTIHRDTDGAKSRHALGLLRRANSSIPLHARPPQPTATYAQACPASPPRLRRFRTRHFSALETPL